MDEKTTSRIYALKVGNFRKARFDIDGIPSPEGVDFEGINPYLTNKLRMEGVRIFFYHNNLANESFPVTDLNQHHSLNKYTLGEYIGHGMALWGGLLTLIEEIASPKKILIEQDRCLGKSIWFSRGLVNTLNCCSSYTGKLLNRAGVIQGEGKIDDDQFLERARELYMADQIDDYFQIASGTLEMALAHRERMRDFGLDLIQRLLDDPIYDVCNESMLTPEEKQEYEEAINRAEECEYDFYGDPKSREKVARFPNREAFLAEQRKMDQALSGLEHILQRFHERVLDYSGVKK